MTSELSLFQQVLLATDGTVTELIALYACEPIRVKKLLQEIRVEAAPIELACATPARLLIRAILLAGAKTNYLHAESTFVLERLPERIRQQMLDTDRPVGLLWREQRLETFREIVRQSIDPCPAVAHHFGLQASAPFVSRTYLVHHAGRPMGMITEQWPLKLFRGP